MQLKPSLPRGLLAGAIAGAAGSLAMDLFQGSVASFQQTTDGTPAPGSPQNTTGETTTEKTAREVSEHFGHHLTGPGKQRIGRTVHYAFGTLMGAAYGASAEFLPIITAGHGAAFGTALLLGTDELSLPLLDLASKPSQTPPVDHLLHLASHLVYAGTLELCRNLLRTRSMS